MTDRRQEAYSIRLEAAELARSREHPHHKANGDEQQFAGDRYFMSFTKGLPHNPATGLLHDPEHFVEYRRAIDDGFIDPFSHRVPHGAEYEVDANTFKLKCHVPPKDFRQWEAPTAGTAYELQGPDAQAVTMPPAPSLLDASGQPNPELIFEIAEVYELALLRDQPLTAFENGQNNPDVLASLDRLKALPYASNPTGRPRKREQTNTGLELTEQTLFRGSSPGVEVGPYLSQFLIIGNADHNGAGSVTDGKISYGVLHVDQQVPVAVEGQNYMQDMTSYVEAQRGLKPPREVYEPDPNPGNLPVQRRFIRTPRDLATYVHYDALYEAYLNACIILLGMGTPFDPSFDHLSGVGAAAGNGDTRRNAGGFALYGGPHILTLVTEVATRALKAVRFQKFNNHIRLRPEALAARIELARLHPSLSQAAQDTVPPALLKHMAAYRSELEGNGGGTLQAINSLNGNNGYFLPMAFPEGSPMHPAYGAGHATVAGACVTILKAFFDTSTVLVKTNVAKPGDPPSYAVKFKRYDPSKDVGVIFRVNANGSAIVPTDPETTNIVPVDEPLTLEGELNKLAANISIGRNMAGVHYFSDYYDSLRMGEQIAIGILEEQALTYPSDPFVLSVPTFDGDTYRIGRR